MPSGGRGVWGERQMEEERGDVCFASERARDDDDDYNDAELGRRSSSPRPQYYTYYSPL